MASTNSNQFFSLPAALTIARFLRVKPDGSGNAVVAGAERSVGTVVSQNPDYTVGIDGGRSGSKHYIANEAIAVGSAVYGAAAGKVTDTSAVGAEFLGYALSASGADGDVIEVLAASNSVVTA